MQIHCKQVYSHLPKKLLAYSLRRNFLDLVPGFSRMCPEKTSALYSFQADLLSLWDKFVGTARGNR